MNLNSKIRSIINPSGGLSYHYSALRYSKYQWSPFIKELSHWLESWPLRSRKLLLIGPSGGYSLSTSFLQLFEKIDAIDTDPLAQNIFSMRHKVDVEWNNQDIFGTTRRIWQPSKLASTLNDYPDHQILFCNILGQLPLLFPQLVSKVEWEQWQRSFQKSIKGRVWASYHDLFSINIKIPNLNEEILRKWERDQNSPPEVYFNKLLSGYIKKTTPIYDHCTLNLFPPGRRKLLSWKRIPKAIHIIEARRN